MSGLMMLGLALGVFLIGFETGCRAGRSYLFRKLERDYNITPKHPKL